MVSYYFSSPPLSTSFSLILCVSPFLLRPSADFRHFSGIEPKKVAWKAEANAGGWEAERPSGGGGGGAGGTVEVEVADQGEEMRDERGLKEI